MCYEVKIVFVGNQGTDDTGHSTLGSKRVSSRLTAPGKWPHINVTTSIGS